MFITNISKLSEILHFSFILFKSKGVSIKCALLESVKIYSVTKYISIKKNILWT